MAVVFPWSPLPKAIPCSSRFHLPLRVSKQQVYDRGHVFGIVSKLLLQKYSILLLMSIN